MSKLAISYQDIIAAQNTIKHVVNKTPVFTSRQADAKTGAKLYFKCENFQRMGAFKFRGAYNALSQLTKAQKQAGVVTFSSGNHAQAIALSANLLGIKSLIVMPEDAPQIKVEATKGYGGEVVFYDRYTQDREAIGKRYVEEQKMTLIPPFDHPHVMAGQGTATKELFDQVGELDLLVSPIGGGGLISGAAMVAKTLNPKCKVIGVEPEKGNDAQQSLEQGKIVKIEVPKTIADGAQTQFIGKKCFPVIQQLVDEIVNVTDSEIIETMKFLAGRMKMIVEPTGCMPTAAIFNNKIDVAGKKVGLILSGGNIDLDSFASMIKG